MDPTGSLGEPDGLRWHAHGERSLYESDWVHLNLVDVTPPNGKRFEHHVVRLQRVVLVVVVDDDERVLMLWRHRFVTNTWGWELPGGIVEAGELPERAAERETLEETGWVPRSLKKLIEFQPMPGMVDTPHEIYISRDAEYVAEPSDEEEASVVRWVPVVDVPGLIEHGLIAGAGSLIGLLQLLNGPVS